MATVKLWIALTTPETEMSILTSHSGRCALPTKSMNDPIAHLFENSIDSKKTIIVAPKNNTKGMHTRTQCSIMITHNKRIVWAMWSEECLDEN